MHPMYIFEEASYVRRFFFFTLAVVMCSLILALTAFAQSGSVYADPQQRFTIQVPTGWLAKPNGPGGAAGVTILRGGDTFVRVSVQKGIEPAVLLKTLNNGMESKLPGYRISYQGSRNVAGQSRTFVVGESPQAPNAPRTRVYLETFAANGFSYTVEASSLIKNIPGQDLMADHKISQEIIQSLAPKSPPAQTSIAMVPAPPLSSRHAISDGDALSSASNVLSPKDQKKLAALDAAFQGGALSEEEYQVKKVSLYSSALQRKNNSALLKILNQAYTDGVLTKDEYDRKKDALAAAGAPGTALQVPNRDSEIAHANTAEDFTFKSVLQPEPLPKSWITHNDPGGFAVNLPASWAIDKVSSSGQVVLRGTHGEEILIWPLHLQQPKLDAQGAAAMVQELARKFDVLMPWSAVQTAPNAARVIGLGAERSGTAVLSWANGPSAASICFYAVEAPAEVYRDSTDSFVAILKSFHVVQNSSSEIVPGAAKGSGTGELKFVNWSDPREGAFGVSVPQGWHVLGGAYRLSAVDTRHSVVMTSTDGQVRASMGDPLVGAFTQPTQALAAAGLGEGGYETLGDGTRVEILRYNSGQQFARSYVSTLVSRQCNNPRVNFTRAREDLAAELSESAASAGFADALFTAGEVSFTCNLDGRTARGKYVAATIRMAPGFSPLWFVYRLYGYIAAAGREQDGEKVLAQMIQTSKFDPDWLARQRDAANAAMLQGNEPSERVREDAERSIAGDQRQSHELIANADQQLQKFYDQIDLQRENSVVGKLDVVDPETGKDYKMGGFGDYHYLSNDGYLYSASSPGEPESDLRAMVALP
jgi:hypothetical protein